MKFEASLPSAMRRFSIGHTNAHLLRRISSKLRCKIQLYRMRVNKTEVRMQSVFPFLTAWPFFWKSWLGIEVSLMSGNCIHTCAAKTEKCSISTILGN